MKIQLISSNKINREKWDKCVESSLNPFIYATSIYLDKMADNWDGIVGNNYEIVMPIPWRRKFGIKYCYSVPFIQQLGVFGKVLKQQDINDCLNLLIQSFKYGTYTFHSINHIKDSDAQNNYVLSLASNYNTIASFYSNKLKANLRKSAKYLLLYSNATMNEAIKSFYETNAHKLPKYLLRDYYNFSKLCKLKDEENNLVIRKITSDNKVLAINLFLKDKFRIYNLMSCVLPEGRKISAGHLLLDSFIKEFSQTGMLLDFEGSNVPGVAHFYKNFGAINQPYPKIHFNRLPYFLRLFKH